MAGTSLMERWEERDSCVSCDSSPSCNCAADERCILTSRTCSQCASIQCIKDPSTAKSSVNPGLIAGPIVAVLVIASLALFWWLRKKKRRDLARLEELAARARKAESAGFHLSAPSSPRPSSPHSATSSQRHAPRARSPLPPAPVNAQYYDENGATIRVYGGQAGGTIDLKRSSPRYEENNPFADRESVSTMGTGMSGQSTNIIPIQYIPSSTSDEGHGEGGGGGGGGGGMSSAARLLNEARQNLLAGPSKGPPRRPARSPDLDLRLNPPAAGFMPDGYLRDSLRSPGAGSGAGTRDSYLSGTSGAPSFVSGMSYDVHADAPRIVTSKQVHVGRLQQAEVVNLGNGTGAGGKSSPVLASNATFGSGSQHLDGSAGGGVGRSLTPSASRNRQLDSPTEGLSAQDEPPSSAGSGDLRFSMGSLAYRDSVSTMGTSRYLARPDSAAPARGLPHHLLPPPTPKRYNADAGGDGQRESMFSTKSYADSVLSDFPMIPPGQGHPPASSSMSNLPPLPQSSSISTLDHAAMGSASVSRPPPAFKSVPSPRPGVANAGGGGGAGSRPMTATSVADSFLGSFPFVPPNVDDLAELPSAALPSGVGAGTRMTQMSTASEGLGGFDFSFAGGKGAGVPPVPGRK